MRAGGLTSQNQLPVSANLLFDFRDKTFQGGIPSLLGSTYDVGERRRRRQLSVYDFHLWPHVSLTQQSDTKSCLHRRNDTGGAGALEHGFQVRASILTDVNRPMSVEAVIVEREERDRRFKL